MSTIEPFPVYFGGEMRSEWIADTLKINYTDRAFVFAVPGENGGWIAHSQDFPLLAAEINECRHGLKRAYFETYASISAAITAFIDCGGSISSLPDHLTCPFSPLAMTELLRVLLDDWGLKWEPALDIVARCRFTPAPGPYRLTVQEIASIQPRTAQLMTVLRDARTHDQAVVRCYESVLSRLITHNCAMDSYRSPIGSMPTGSVLQLRLRDESGLVEHAVLVVDGDNYHHEQPMSNDLSCVYLLPDTPIALRYRFRLSLVADQTCYLRELFGKQSGLVSWGDGSGFRLTVYDKNFQTPAWFRRKVMYHIFPDRFARDNSDTAQKGIAYHRALGRRIDASSWDHPVKWQPGEGETLYMPNDIYGGTLKGIMEQLPYLQSLGVGVLYLNPIVESCSNHRYDAADYLRPDPILGTIEDFRDLVQEALHHGIRIILDGVYSHTGADSIYFNRYGRYQTLGAYQSVDSPYYPWYDFSEFPDKYRSWWGFETLPEVRESNPEWQDFVVTGENSVLRYWLRNGASGWRLDVADELPDSVLELIRAATKEESQDNVVLGEVWEDAIEKESYGVKRRYALGNALDTVMNYPFRSAVLSFLSGWTTAEAMSDFLLAQRLHYPKPMYYSLMNLLSSHDVPRIRTMLAVAPEGMPGDRPSQFARQVTDAEDIRGAALQKLAAAISFAIPGVPSVYYGDETGMNGFTDPFNRAPFTQGAHPLTDWYRALGKLRNENPALSTGSMAAYAPHPDVLAVLRMVTGGRDAFGLPTINGQFLLVVNRSEQPVCCALDLMEPGHGLDSIEQLALRRTRCCTGVPVLGDGQLTIQDGQAEILLHGMSACIFQLK